MILYCHGGGCRTGSCLYARAVTTKLAAAANMDVLAFDYGLAPEKPFPGALTDARKAWDYLMLWGYGARDVFGGMWHVFHMSPFKTASDAMDRIGEFIYDIS